jgi:hypothetical protein
VYGPLVTVRAMQYIPFVNWKDSNLISVAKDEKSLRCALYYEEDSKLYIFDNLDDSENAKPFSDLNLISDYFDDRHIERIFGSKEDVDLICEFLGN